MQVNIGGLEGLSHTNGMITPSGMVQFGSDNHTNVTFYKRSVLDSTKSREEGRPFYVSKDYVRIQQPGEHLNIIDRPIDDDPRVKLRWPIQYQNFQNNSQQEIPEGTPIEILFPNAPEIPANLHTQAVHTVEQLSNLTAHALQSIGMGSVEWQGQARKFLDSAKGGMEYHKLVKNNQDLQSKVEVLMNQISLLNSQLNRLMAAQQGIPGTMIPNSAPTVAQAMYQNPAMQFPQNHYPPATVTTSTSMATYTGPYNEQIDLPQLNLPPTLTQEPDKPVRINRKG